MNRINTQSKIHPKPGDITTIIPPDPPSVLLSYINPVNNHRNGAPASPRHMRVAIAANKSATATNTRLRYAAGIANRQPVLLSPPRRPPCATASCSSSRAMSSAHSSIQPHSSLHVNSEALQLQNKPFSALSAAARVHVLHLHWPHAKEYLPTL